MRIVIKLLVVVAMLATTHSAWASYTFTMNLQIDGNCGGMQGSIEKRMVEEIFDHYINQVSLGIPSRAECEQLRQIVMSSAASGNNYCKARIVCGPCTGSGGMGDAPSVNIEGPSKGGSFYSGNASSEIKDWDQQNNALKQMLSGNSTNALPQNTWTASVYKNADSWIANGNSSQGKEFASNAKSSRANGFVIDNSKPFVSLNDRPISYGEMMPIAQKPYLEESRLNTLLWLGGGDYKKVEKEIRKMFYEQTGCTEKMLSELQKKPENQLTDNEKKILKNYDEFSDDCYKHMRETAIKDEGKREIDMAILAEDVYHDSKHEFIGETLYKRYTDEILKNEDDPNNSSNPLYKVAMLIEQYNEKEKDTGFHAEIYYNSVTDEYAISFEGSSSQTKDWANNILNGVGADTPQFLSALEIGKAVGELPEGYNINFTGHSLGGGLASVAGLVSGAPTITFNAEGISDDFLAKHDLLDKKNSHDYNIKAIISNTDLLNVTQKYVVPTVEAGVNATLPLNPINALGTAIGDQKYIGPGFIESYGGELGRTGVALGSGGMVVPKKTNQIETAGIHQQEPIIKYLNKTNEKSQKMWNNWKKIDSQRNKNKKNK